MFVSTNQQTAQFGGSDGELEIHKESSKGNQEVRMETKSPEDEFLQTSEENDSPEFNSANPPRKQSQAGAMRNQIYREKSFTKLGEVRVPRIKKNRRDTDKMRKANESDEN